MYQLHYLRPGDVNDEVWKIYTRIDPLTGKKIDWFNDYPSVEAVFNDLQSVNIGPVAYRIFRVEIMKTGGRV